jgi:hypothetical protein
MADDGWVSFFESVTQNTDRTHDAIPIASGPNGVIAPFWADLDPWRLAQSPINASCG